MLKAILFDLGDTLFDFQRMEMRRIFHEIGLKTYAHLQSLGHQLPPFRRYFSLKYRSVQLSYLWSRLTGRDFNTFDVLCRNCRKMKLELDEETLRDLAWRWYQPITEYASVAEDVVPILTRFRDRGLKLALISNTLIPGFVLDRHLEMHGLLEFFPVRVYSSETGYRKPGARIFHAALEQLGVSASEAVFVGDNLRKDIMGARKVGMGTILRKPRAESRTHPVADHVIRTMSELYQILPLLGGPAEREMPVAEALVGT